MLSKRSLENYNKMTLEPDLTDLNRLSQNLKGVIGLTLKNDENNALLNKNIPILKLKGNSGESTKSLTEEKHIIEEEMMQSRIRKNKITYDEEHSA